MILYWRISWSVFYASTNFWVYNGGQRLRSQLLLKNNMVEGIKWQDNVSPHRHKSFVFLWPTYLTRRNLSEEKFIMTPGLMMQPIIMQCQGNRSYSYVCFIPCLTRRLREQNEREVNHAEIHFLQVPLTLKSVTLALNKLAKPTIL